MMIMTIAILVALGRRNGREKITLNCTVISSPKAH